MLFRKRKPVPAPQSVRSDLQRHQQLMANDICDRLRFLREHVHPNPSSELPVIIADSFDYVTEMSKALIRLGKESERTADEKSGKHRYVVSSRLLMDAWRYLTADQEHRERMAPVIGFVMPDGTNVLTEMAVLPMSSQSAAYVQLAQAPTTAFIDEITEHQRHRVHAFWHSHILKGATASQPSQTDLTHQERLVTLGMTKCLGGIYTLDGYVRFFSTAIDFDVAVYGAGVAVVSDKPREKIFKLDVEEANHVSEAA